MPYKMNTQLHPVEQLRGIGPVTAEALSSQGITHTEDLLYTEEFQVANELAEIDGISYSEVFDNYAPISKLLRVDGLSVDDSYQLYDIGVRDYQSLAWSWLPWLQSKFRERDEVDIIKWQLDAAKRMDTGTLYAKIVDEENNPLTDASVEIVNPFKKPSPHAAAWTSRENGCVNCEYLTQGTLEYVVIAEGFSQKRGFVSITQNTATYLKIRLSAGDASKPVIDEQIEGIILAELGRPVLRPVFEGAPPHEISAVWVSAENRVTSLYWSQSGAEITTPSYTGLSMPANASIGDVLVKDLNNAWSVVGNDWLQWRNNNRREIDVTS